MNMHKFKLVTTTLKIAMDQFSKEKRMDRLRIVKSVSKIIYTVKDLSYFEDLVTREVYLVNRTYGPDVAGKDYDMYRVQKIFTSINELYAYLIEFTGFADEVGKFYEVITGKSAREGVKRPAIYVTEFDKQFSEFEGAYIPHDEIKSGTNTFLICKFDVKVDKKTNMATFIDLTATKENS